MLKFLNLQDGDSRHLGLLKFQTLSSEAGSKGTSPYQISSKPVNEHNGLLTAMQRCSVSASAP